MFLDCGRRPENLERSHTNTGRTMTISMTWKSNISYVYSYIYIFLSWIFVCLLCLVREINKAVISKNEGGVGKWVIVGRSRQLPVLLFPLCRVFPPWFFRSQPHACAAQPVQYLRLEQTMDGDGCGRRGTFGLGGMYPWTQYSVLHILHWKRYIDKNPLIYWNVWYKLFFFKTNDVYLINNHFILTPSCHWRFLLFSEFSLWLYGVEVAAPSPLQNAAVCVLSDNCKNVNNVTLLVRLLHRLPATPPSQGIYMKVCWFTKHGNISLTFWPFTISQVLWHTQLH